MSGLLRRLAAQAGGQRGVTLHAPARLPFQPAPERLDSGEARLPAALPGAALPALMELPASPAITPTAAVPPARPHAATAQRPGEAPPAPAVQAEEPSPVQQPRLPEPLLAEQPLNLVIHAPDAAPTETAAPTPLAMHETPPHHQAPPGVDAAPPSPAAPRLPPLLAPMASATAAPTRAAPPPAEPVPRQPDEVHIHIGRIEVTAIQETAPARREARKGPPPLSLDDYLARRNGDRR
ncbi:hypothetical protein VV867_07245 [Pseudomonas sp. JH-2]|uniref:hypothetical protein n=1 Tax=Pseudomonas sp. JH-2 TaxID=3114998 RepID=UPI002E25C820|nr:hypothetical protein [Pseudomonas sp. JH-2]